MRDVGSSRTSPSTLESDWRRSGRALRVSGWWYFAGLPLVSLVDEPLAAGGRLLHAAGSVLVAALCMAYAFGLNGITDRLLDHDESKNSLAGMKHVPWEAVVLVTACALGAAMIAAALGPVALGGATVSLVAGTLYSARIRLKRLPVLGTLVNVMIFAPLPLLALVSRPSPGMQFLTYCFLFLVTQNQILHEVADGGEDAGGGIRTTGVVAGRIGLRWIALVLGPIGSLPLWWIPVAAAPQAIATAGLCVGSTMVALCTPPVAARLRVTHRWFSLVVGATLFALLVGRSA